MSRTIPVEVDPATRVIPAPEAVVPTAVGSPFQDLDPAGAVAVSAGIYTLGGLTAVGGLLTVTNLSDSGVPSVVAEMHHTWLQPRVMTWADVTLAMAWLSDMDVEPTAGLAIGLTWANGTDPTIGTWRGRTIMWLPGNGTATKTTYGVLGWANNAGVSLVGASSRALTVAGSAVLYTKGASKILHATGSALPNGTVSAGLTADTDITSTDAVYTAISLCRFGAGGAPASGSFRLGVAA